MAAPMPNQSIQCRFDTRVHVQNFVAQATCDNKMAYNDRTRPSSNLWLHTQAEKEAIRQDGKEKKRADKGNDPHNPHNEFLRNAI